MFPDLPRRVMPFTAPLACMALMAVLAPASVAVMAVLAVLAFLVSPWTDVAMAVAIRKVRTMAFVFMVMCCGGAWKRWCVGWCGGGGVVVVV